MPTTRIVPITLSVYNKFYGYYYSALVALTLLTLALALSIGPAGLDWGDIPPALMWELRLPRALSAFAVGGLLALAGALMQVLLVNPLADPYILGLSGGASCATLLALLFGISSTWLAAAAFLGAVLATILVLGLASLGNPIRLLLTGVVLAAGWGALVSLILTLSPTASLPCMLFWLLGDLSDAEAPQLPLALLAISSLASLLIARPMDLLAQGELQALVFGVATVPLRITIFALSTLNTAVAVATAGSIGFVGLVVPHLLRLQGIDTHKHLIPGVVLLGGCLLLLADTLARILITPRELPVGVITALLGVPTFLYLLQRHID